MGNALQKPTQISEKKPEEEHNDQQDNDINGSSTSTFTCEICIQPILLPNQNFKNGNNCSHPFCIECIVKYISVQIQDNNQSTITCPALNCNNSLDPLFCRQLIPRQLFVKWCDLLCESAVLGFDRCYCPNRDCSALVLNECDSSSNVKRSECPNCNKLFCFQCKMTWHAGYRCEESGEMRDRNNDIAFGVLAERNKWMSCPLCHRFIELIRGCKIVRCRCGIEFCYNCGKKVNNHRCRCNVHPMECNWCCTGYILVVVFFVVFLYVIIFKLLHKFITNTI